MGLISRVSSRTYRNMAEKNEDLQNVLREIDEITVVDVPETQKSDKNKHKNLPGEEHETEVFCARCKLYWFSDNQWYVHGVGDLRVLVPLVPRDDNDKQTSKPRMVMRREDVLNLAINHLILASNEMKLNDGKVMWRCTDFSHPDDGDAGFN